MRESTDHLVIGVSKLHARYGALLVLLIVGAVLRLRSVTIEPLSTSDTRVYMTMAALPYPVAALTWHSDAMEVRRHAVQLGVQFQLGLWLLLLFAIDRGVDRGLSFAGEALRGK